MNISTLVLNFHDQSDQKNNDYLIKLQNDNIIDIKYWIAESKYANIKRYRSFVNDNDFTSENIFKLDATLEDYLYDKYFTQYVDCASRKYIDIKKHNELYYNIFKYSYYDTRDEFRLLCNYFYNMIKIHDIKLILFFSVPHHSWDLICYYLAQTLNIKTVIYNLFPYFDEDCSHILISNIEDIGTYATAIENKEIQTDQNITDSSLNRITKVKKYYYATSNKEKQEMYRYNKNSSPAIKFNNMANFYLHNKLSQIIAKYKSILKSFKRALYEIKIKNIKPSMLLFKNIILGRLAYKESQITIDANKSYFARYNKYAQEIDDNDKFILFALHYQPELTTSPVAGIYSDQMLAIERLSYILPDGYVIYVKENPIQDYHMRGDLFFKRLSLLKNVKLIKIEYNTMELLEKSVFVATICGTIGMEAIYRNKNVLIFTKNVWYSQFSGVHIYNTSMTNIDNLLKKTTNNFMGDILKVHRFINNCLHFVNNPHMVDSNNNQNNLYLELKYYINNLFNK